MRYVEDEDFLEINAWRAARKAAILPADFYGPFGMIVPGVAAGWLSLTDSKVALLENFVTNPKASKEDRNHAITEISACLERIAHQKGYRYLMAITKNPWIAKVARGLDFKSCGTSEILGKEFNYGLG